MPSPTSVRFVPEGHADTALTLTLLGENQPILRTTETDRIKLRQFVDTEQGIGNVGNSMMRQLESFGDTRRVVGVVDLDKDFHEKPYLNQFLPFHGSMVRKEHSHALLQHPVYTTHFLVILNPAFEKWVLARTDELGNTPEDFGLPADFKAFRNYCKKRSAEYDPGLRRLLDAIAAANLPAYRALAEFVANVMDLNHPLP